MIIINMGLVLLLFNRIGIIDSVDRSCIYKMMRLIGLELTWLSGMNFEYSAHRLLLELVVDFLPLFSVLV